jgi:hypothetical protein
MSSPRSRCLPSVQQPIPRHRSQPAPMSGPMPGGSQADIQACCAGGSTVQHEARLGDTGGATVGDQCMLPQTLQSLATWLAGRSVSLCRFAAKAHQSALAMLQAEDASSLTSVSQGRHPRSHDSCAALAVTLLSCGCKYRKCYLSLKEGTHNPQPSPHAPLPLATTGHPMSLHGPSLHQKRE